MRTAHDWRDTETNECEEFDPVVVRGRGTRLSIGRDSEDWGSALTFWSREEVDALIARLQSLRHRMLPRDYIERIEAIARCGECPPGPPREPEPEPMCGVRQTDGSWVFKTVAEVYGAGSPVHIEALRLQRHWGPTTVHAIPLDEANLPDCGVAYGDKPAVEFRVPGLLCTNQFDPADNGLGIAVVGPWTPGRYSVEPTIRMPEEGDEHLTLTAKHRGDVSIIDRTDAQAWDLPTATIPIGEAEPDLVDKLERAEEDEGSE